MIRNINDLTKSLCAAIEMVGADPDYVPRARVQGQLSGRVIAACRVQVEYAVARKRKPVVEFLETSDDAK